MKHTISLLIVLIAAFCFASCKKDGGGEGGNFTIKGLVVDESRNPIAGATIKYNDKAAYTDGDGKFVLESLPVKDKFHLIIDAGGYFQGYKNVEAIDESTPYTIIMLASKEQIGTLPAGGGNVSGNGFRIIAGTQSFSNENGSPYAGPVQVAAKYVAQDNPNLENLMPGGNFVAKDENGREGMLISYGFVLTEFKDLNGNILKPANNVQIAVTMPPGAGNPVANGANGWGYNKEEGVWQKSGAVTQNGNEFFYPCTTLSENIDKFTLEYATVEGQVLCTDGNPVPGAMVNINSTQYNNRYATYTNENGRYRARVAVKDGSISFSYTISCNGATVNAGSATPGSVFTAPVLNVSICNGGFQGPVGQAGNPRFNLQYNNASEVDMDLHVITPNGNEIYYDSRSADGGELDVDCVYCGNGDENVFWVPGTAPHGTYTFWVKYYDGTGSSSFTLRVMNINNVIQTYSGTLSSVGAESTHYTFTY